MKVDSLELESARLKKNNLVLEEENIKLKLS